MPDAPKQPVTTIDHPEVPDFWRHEPFNPKPCWICGKPTEWVYLDMDYQHPECEWPLEPL